MTISFERPVGAHADVKELEYVAALHQTCTPLRKDGSIDGKSSSFPDYEYVVHGGCVLLDPLPLLPRLNIHTLCPSQPKTSSTSSSVATRWKSMKMW